METKAVHAGRGVDPATGAVTPPIHLSTTFERDADGGYPRGYEYARESNPNRDALEECVRELEGGAAAAAFSSGMAATMTVLQTFAPGDHVVAKSDDGPFRQIRKVQHSGGAIPSPFECWLTLRGIQTLPYRMGAHSENAARVARFLDGHPAVAEVFYPGLESHPGHRIASEQMSLFGGMLSFLVQGDRERALAVAADVRVFTRATSLGGTHSYVEHRASIEGPGTAAPENLLRLSVGLEHPDDLTEDLARALGPAKR